MRVFADATGIEWTVYEVKKQGGGKERWTYLPEEYGDGWLCFESEISKRRLTPIPQHWRDSSDTRLAQMLGEAQAVTRARPMVENQQAAEGAGDRSA